MMARAREPLQDRIARSHRKEGECWVWTGCYGRDGYGVLTVGRKQVRAHRASYEAFHGKDPGSLLVCHRCDNPRCVNPAHLFLGTHKTNTADMLSKGRHTPTRFGKHALYRIPRTQWPTIRARRKAGEKLESIASDYGVSFQRISEICRSGI